MGPSAMAAPALAPHRPIARARSLRSVKTLAIRESVAGNTMAAPRPMTAREAISPTGVVVRRPPSSPARKQPSRRAACPCDPCGPKDCQSEEESGENQVVGVHHPLELGGGRLQLPHQRR